MINRAGTEIVNWLEPSEQRVVKELNYLTNTLLVFTGGGGGTILYVSSSYAAYLKEISMQNCNATCGYV